MLSKQTMYNYLANDDCLPSESGYNKDMKDTWYKHNNDHNNNNNNNNKKAFSPKQVGVG